MTCMASSSDLVLVAVRQHRQEASALDARRQLALEERARAGEARRRDLAVLVDEIAQGIDVLVIDLLDAGDREAAEALATEQQRLGIALGLAVLGEPTFTAGRGHVMTSLFQFDGLDVEDDATTVALGPDEAFESMLDAHLGGEQLIGDRTDGTGADLQGDLARGAELAHFGLVLQAEIQRRQAGGGESQSASLDDRRRQ